MKSIVSSCNVIKQNTWGAKCQDLYCCRVRSVFIPKKSTKFIIVLMAKIF